MIEVSSLCNANDIVLFTCTTENKKIISLCEKGAINNPSGKYYRFGRKNNIEMDFPKIQDESSFREFRTHLSQSFKGARSLGFSREMSFYNKNYVYVIYDNYIEENSRIADKMDEDEIVPRYGEPKDDRGIVVYKRGIKKNVKVTDLKCNSNYFSLYRNNDKNEGMP